MRKALLFSLLFISAISFSQAPQLLNYQAVARDASGNIITTAIGIKFEILQGSASGTLVYDETNNITPSSAGIFTVAIGSGTPLSGPFSSINWANSPFFIRVSIDPTGGTSYSTVGTSQLLSVPYALYAEKAGNTQTVNITGPNVTGTFPNYTITAPAGLTPSTGISISGGTITNTAPNQTVNITGPNVIGAYPDYTITPGAALTASTGVSIVSGTITNTAPDQTVTISGAVGTYPNFTITPIPATSLTATGTSILITGTGPGFTIVPQPSLTLTGNLLSISDGNTVTLPTGTTYTSGLGISLGSGTVITNSLPDQTVTISNGTNVTVAGTYPNFVVNSTPTLSIGSGSISISGGNSVALPVAPPPTTVIAGTNVTVGGTGPTYTVNATPSLSIGSGSITISGGNSVALPVVPAQTSVTAGTNMVVNGSAPNYTVVSPTYSLTMSNSSTGVLTNGMSTSAVTIPQPTLTLSGTNNNVISAGSNSITISTYTAGNGLTIAGSAPNFTIGTVSTGTSAGWSTLGNSATNASVNFIGTTDNIPFNIRVNNQKAGRIDHLLANAFYGYQAGNANTTGTFNVAFGNQTMLNNTNGSYNTALGTNVLYFNTTGYSNTGSGYQAFYSNTTGFQNTANGYWALYNNTSGNDNNAMGYSALAYNTTGVRNVAVGNFANYSNTTGSQNTAIGHAALYAQSFNPGGPWNSENVAVGIQALYSNQPTSSTNGYQNTAIGSYAMQFNTTGYENTALGHQALFSNNIGTWNTAVGKGVMYNNTSGNHNFGGANYAMYDNTTGSDNVAIGYTAMRYSKSGNENTVYGYEAGFGVSGQSYSNNTLIGKSAGYSLATGSGNVFIGHQAGYSETGSNLLYIANGPGTPLIFGNFSNGRVGIGTNVPVSELDVTGSLRLSGNRLFLGSVGGINSGYTGIYSDASGDLRFAVFESGAPSNPPFASAGNSRDGMIIKNTNGYVGIGTNSPNTPLHVLTPLPTYIKVESSGATQPHGIMFKNPNREWNIINYAGGSDRISFYDATATQERLVIDGPTGNVGVGTNAPQGKLDVNGNVVVPAASNYRYATAKSKVMKIGASEMLSANSASYQAKIDDGFGVTAINGLNSLSTIGGAAGNPSYFIAPVHLPDSAIITAFSAQVVKNGGSLQSVVELWRSDGTGYLANTAQLIASCSTSFSGGAVQFPSAGSINASFRIVDNANYIYFIRYSGEQNSSALRFHLATINYQIYKTD